MLAGGPKKRLKPHQIRPADVAEFLKDSAVTAPVFHGTSLESRDAIIERGVDVLRNQTAIFGRGFYPSSKPIERYGPGIVRVAVLARGFDGIVVQGADFNRANQEVDIIVAADVRTIRIIAE